VAFRTVSLLHQHRCKTGQTGAISALVHAMKSCRNFSQRMHPFRPIGPQTHVFERFGPFHYCTNSVTKWAELMQLMHKLGPRSRFAIFSTNVPDPPYLNPNSCFGAFRTVCYSLNFHAKRAELVQLMHKFVQRSRVGIFCDERTRSTPLDPKLIFWAVSDRFFHT
jgi:hypothetical protein